MSNEIIKGATSQELIDIPSFLSNNTGISTYASGQCTSGCQAEQDDPCTTTIMICGFKEVDCTSTQVCGNAECGECDACQSLGMCSTCEDTCMRACQVHAQGGCSDACESVSQASPIDVDYWYWTKSNGDASASQTRAAYAAVVGHGEVKNFNYLVWNDLVNKLYEVKQYAGFEWNAFFDLYENTLMTADDKVLTALRFNSVRYNIGIHVSTGIEQVYRGDDVIGDYFIIIADCINEFIDSLA